MMTVSSDIISKALLRSLAMGPSLIEDLPEGPNFPFHLLIPPEGPVSLNLQQKLGHLYEDALAELLKSNPRFDCLARGVQLRQDAGHTLGELDYIVHDRVSDQMIHLELAIKFYLAVETKRGVLLPGPDARDNYFKKLEKMRSHQLRLVEKFKHLLPEKFRDQKIITQQLVQGCIFNHVQANHPVEAEFLNPNGRRGKWLHVKDCADYFPEGTRLEVIPKPLWPVPLEILKPIELEGWEPDRKIDRCVMVRSIQCIDGDPVREALPYFITPDGYPFG